MPPEPVAVLPVAGVGCCGAGCAEADTAWLRSQLEPQGITIDAARVFFRTAQRPYIIIDAPGHIEFLRNLVTGAARAEMHETTGESMAPLATLEIKPGETVELKPGGYHIMFMQL